MVAGLSSGWRDCGLIQAQRRSPVATFGWLLGAIAEEGLGIGAAAGTGGAGGTVDAAGVAILVGANIPLCAEGAAIPWGEA
jgi:hypothetical protein